MIIEYAQILSTAHRILDGVEKTIVTEAGRNKRIWEHPDAEKNERLYGVTHRNHPSAVWVRESIANYLWVYECMWWCNQEFRRRYGHEKNHATLDRLSQVLSIAPLALLNGATVEFTPPPQCVADDCKTENTVAAYRDYYNKHKAGIAKWREGNIPEWFKGI